MSESLLFNEWGQFVYLPHRYVRLWPVIGREAFSLLVILIYHSGLPVSDDKGKKRVAWPSYDTITRETKLTRRSIARAIRVLEKYDLITRKKQFQKASEYTIKFITDEQVDSILAAFELESRQNLDNIKELDNENPQSPHIEGNGSQSPQGEGISSLRARGSTVSQRGGNKSHESRLNKQDSDIAPAVSADDESPEKVEKSPEQRYKERIAAAMQRGATRHYGQEIGLDLDQWPEEWWPWIKGLHQHFFLSPPKKTKGGEYATWLKQFPDLRDACAEFGPELLADLGQEWWDETTAKKGRQPFTLARPKALVTRARSMVMVKRNGGQGDPIADKARRFEISHRLDRIDALKDRMKVTPERQAEFEAEIKKLEHEIERVLAGKIAIEGI